MRWIAAPLLFLSLTLAGCLAPSQSTSELATELGCDARPIPLPTGFTAQRHIKQAAECSFEGETIRLYTLGGTPSESAKIKIMTMDLDAATGARTVFAYGDDWIVQVPVAADSGSHSGPCTYGSVANKLGGTVLK